MKKKILALVLVLALATTGVVGASMAYLQDDDSDVNVMTLGNVQIEQIEQERGENGLEQFKNGPMYPVTKDTMSGYDKYYTADWTETTANAADMEYGMFSNDNNIVDKIVSVKNTGKSDAYVRTIFAFEMKMVGGNPVDPVGTDVMYVVNDRDIDWVKDNEADDEYITIQVGDTWYIVGAYYYDNGSILAPGNTTEASLLQAYLKSTVGNEWYEQCGDEYNILVLSQAIQTAGFANATIALDEGFGAVNEVNAAEWFGGLQMPGEPAPANAQAEYNGTTYPTIYEAVAAANANGGGTITLKGSCKLDNPVEINSNITIKGEKALTTYTRAEGYTGTMFSVGAGATLTTENIVLDGAGATATGNLIATEGNGSIVLNADSVLMNNNGAHAVSLATRGGGTLTLNSAQIINNSSDSGAIWGGGHIIVNDGSKISHNSSTGSAGAIRMVGKCNLTMNGGEISNNYAAGDGGAIWGYGVNGNSSIYNLNGGKMSGNESAGTGGAIYTGNYSVINISGDFEMCDNKAANSGAIRLTDHTSLTMTGGEISGNTQSGASNAFNTWNNSISITGGSIADNFSYVGGLGLTIGAADIDGVIAYDLSTNHNTAYLAENFNSFKFTVNEDGGNFANFNFKPAAGYTYTAGDEVKLICMNAGYSTYWDAASGTFKLKAE